MEPLFDCTEPDVGGSAYVRQLPRVNREESARL